MCRVPILDVPCANPCQGSYQASLLAGVERIGCRGPERELHSRCCRWCVKFLSDRSNSLRAGSVPESNLLRAGTDTDDLACLARTQVQGRAEATHSVVTGLEPELESSGRGSCMSCSSVAG